MNKVLFSIYTDGYPNQFAGGPNNIIYKIIKDLNSLNYSFNYISKDLFAQNLSAENLKKLSNSLSTKKKTAAFLFENSLLYRTIVSSDLYYPLHLKKKNKYFQEFSLKNKRYDIIHSQDSISLALIANKNLKSKKILTVHSNGPLSLETVSGIKQTKLKNKIKDELQQLEKEALKIADIITFPSYSAKDIFFNDLGVEADNKKIRIIYNGINFEEINEINADKDILRKYDINNKYDFLFVNISTYREERQLDKLFNIVKILSNKLKIKIFLLNIGSGPKCEPLMNLVKQIGVEKNVKLLGKIPNEDVIKILKVTDIFLMTTKRVIFDISLLEALASGACCIVSDDGGNKEIIKDAVNGYLIDVNDIEGAAKKIVSVNIEKVQDEAIKTAKQFSVQKMADNYLNLYEELLNGV